LTISGKIGLFCPFAATSSAGSSSFAMNSEARKPGPTSRIAALAELRADAIAVRQTEPGSILLSSHVTTPFW
jgi:hypothetical protein